MTALPVTLAKAGRGKLKAILLVVAMSFVTAACTHASAAPKMQELVLTPDTDWWQPPSDTAVGDISAVAVGPDGDIWVLHRPRSLPLEDQARAAAPVLRFTASGWFVGAYGGPREGYDWPNNEHSLAVDAEGHFWVSGSFRNDPQTADDAILEFDGNGQFVKQIGGHGASLGDFDTANVRAASDIFVDVGAQEVFVSDGYVNHRIIVFDRLTGQFKRMWGAFGSQPPAQPDDGADEDVDTPFFAELHGIEIADDGRVYVADRGRQRVQIFTRDGRYLDQFRVDPGLAEPRTASGIAFSADPKQSIVFVSDWGNSRLLAFDRRNLRELANVGGVGSAPGQMQGPHIIATDRKGIVYVAEVQGRRVQRFIPALR